MVIPNLVKLLIHFEIASLKIYYSQIGYFLKNPKKEFYNFEKMK